MIYDVKIDDRGRILLPIKIRDVFKKGARIVWNERTLQGTIEPIDAHFVVAEMETRANLLDLLDQSKFFNVLIGVAKADANSNTLHVSGQYNNVRSFLELHGVQAEDFDDCIIEERALL